MALSREQLKAKAGASRRYELVTLPTGGDVRIRSLTRGERREWHKSCQKKDGSEDKLRARYFDDVLLSMSACDDSGSPMFTVAEALVGCWDAFEMADTSAILQACVKLNGIGDEVESKDVSDAVKNSDETPENATSGVSVASTE